MAMAMATAMAMAMATMSNHFLRAIDFNVQTCGKYIAHTKRRVQWRFSYNKEECELTLIWSIISGKRLVLVGDKVVHFSICRGTSVDVSYTTVGTNVLRVVARWTAPQAPETRTRQYDLFINGKSFFSLPAAATSDQTVASSSSAGTGSSFLPTQGLSGHEVEKSRKVWACCLSIVAAVVNLPRHETYKPKHITRVYTVKVPKHISPGDHFYATGNDGTGMLVKCPPFNSTARRIDAIVLLQPQHETNEPKHKITCTVKIPLHISPGDHFFATLKDGSKKILVTCPSFAQPGTVIRLTIYDEHHHHHVL